MGKGGFSWENEDKPWDLWQLLWENEDQRWDVFCDFSWEKSQTKLWDLRVIAAGIQQNLHGYTPILLWEAHITTFGGTETKSCRQNMVNGNSRILKWRYCTI
jgi:hypothetical protein